MISISQKFALRIFITGLFVAVTITAFVYQSLPDNSYVVIWVLLLIFVFLFSVAVSQNLVLPIKNLTKDAKNASFVAEKSKDEIGELAKTFTKLSKESKESKAEAEALKKTADIKFKTKEIMSEKVIGAMEEKIKNRTYELENAMLELERLKENLKIKDKEILKLNSQLGKQRKNKK